MFQSSHVMVAVFAWPEAQMSTSLHSTLLLSSELTPFFHYAQPHRFYTQSHTRPAHCTPPAHYSNTQNSRLPPGAHPQEYLLLTVPQALARN
jgi:hypothetical protein